MAGGSLAWGWLRTNLLQRKERSHFTISHMWMVTDLHTVVVKGAQATQTRPLRLEVELWSNAV